MHLKRILRDVIGEMDHKYLNDQAPFDAINPSAENIAKYFYDERRSRCALPSCAANLQHHRVGNGHQFGNYRP